MAAIQGANQSPRVTTGFMNQSGRKGDPAPGVLVSTANVSGSIVQPYAGMLGGLLTLSPADALKLSDTSVATLYSGQYRYVQFFLTSTAANALGQPVFWKDTENAIVTPDGGATTISQVAGITLNATTKGNYDFIQCSGKASVKFGTVTKTTPAIGDAVYINATAANPTLADVIADATALTSPQLKLWIGVATAAAPATNTVSTVLLRSLPELFF